MTRALITGIGAVTPFGVGAEAVWDALREGRSGVGEIEKFDTDGHRVKIGAEVLGFDPTDRIDLRESKAMDPYALLAAHASAQALEDAGIDMEKENPYRVSCNVGTGIGGMWEHEGQFRVLHDKGPRRVSPYYIPKNIVNIGVGIITIRHGIKGYSYAPVAACSTSAVAIGDALRLLREGRADVVVTGGSEAAITPISVAGFANMRALATGYDDAPTKASRPFDVARCGFVMGEGAVVYVLETEEHARARGAQAFAEVAGYAVTSDAFHITSPDPAAEAPAAAMRLALEDAEVPVEAVDYVNAHGTSTLFNDRMETLAIKGALGEVARSVPVSSTKSMHGHLLGAAAAIEGLACIQAIRERLIPPTINLDDPDPECDLEHVPHKPREAAVEVAMSNSFAFGGHNACLVFRAV